MRCFFTPLVHCPPKGKSRKAPRLSPSKPSGPAWPLVPLLLERRSIYLSQCRRHTMLEASGASLSSPLSTQTAQRNAKCSSHRIKQRETGTGTIHTNRALNQHVAYLPTYLSRLLLPPFSTFLTSYQLRDPCQDYRSLS